MNQQLQLTPDNDMGAIFSDDRKYRYALWRIWDGSKPFIQFIGLNPSTADETQNDPTIRKVIKFAKRWGYGGIYMTNLFAYVSSNPMDLLAVNDTVGDNDKHLLSVKEMCKGNVLFAWGNFKEAKKRSKTVANMFEQAVCLGLNKDGSPKHPLYIKDATDPVTFTSC